MMAGRMPNPIFTPLEAMRLSMQFGMMLAEAQWVIALRLWGIAGIWNVAGSEKFRMLAEKPPAMLASAVAAQKALAGGGTAAGAALAALQPIRRKTGANARRLTRRGPASKP